MKVHKISHYKFEKVPSKKIPKYKEYACMHLCN